MRNLVGISLAAVFLAGCSHTLNFRASHFASPIVKEEQWSGHVAIVGSGVTKVTIIDDIESNPPLKNGVSLNNSVGVEDLFGVNFLGLDAGLTIFKGTEIYLDNSLIGARYQFLNHGASAQNWVASIQGAVGGRGSSTTSKNSNITIAEAKSEISTSQAGISLGYKLERIVPYLSYIYESHRVSTKVTNTHGEFGPYKDNGIHQYVSLGFMSHGRGLRYGIEYSFIFLDWENSDRASQEVIATKLGFAW